MRLPQFLWEISKKILFTPSQVDKFIFTTNKKVCTYSCPKIPIFFYPHYNTLRFVYPGERKLVSRRKIDAPIFWNNLAELSYFQPYYNIACVYAFIDLFFVGESLNSLSCYIDKILSYSSLQLAPHCTALIKYNRKKIERDIICSLAFFGGSGRTSFTFLSALNVRKKKSSFYNISPSFFFLDQQCFFSTKIM